MNNIKLDKIHIGKLLIMIKKLYSGSIINIESFESPDIDINNKTIHWFEFCVLDLTTKLYNLNKRYEITKIELYRGDLIQNHHPVDYLYEEFLFYLKSS